MDEPQNRTMEVLTQIARDMGDLRSRTERNAQNTQEIQKDIRGIKIEIMGTIEPGTPDIERKQSLRDILEGHGTRLSKIEKSETEEARTKRNFQQKIAVVVISIVCSGLVGVIVAKLT